MLLPLLVLILTSVFGYSQSKPDLSIRTGDFEFRIDSLFKHFDALETPGYAIGISIGDSTLYQKGFGIANLDYGVHIEPNSKFSIASVSKQFTAASIALLILDKKLSLDTPASKFIPELAKYEHEILVKHLIYNTSGIIDYYRLPRGNGLSWITFNYFDIDECIHTSLNQDTLLFKPGDRWDYSNVNFMLLTKIVEKISEQPFSAFIKENLFIPLGMDNTFINDDITVVVKNRVIPYNFRTEENIESYADYGVKLKREGEFIQHHRNSPHYGGSGVITTIEDLLIWSKNMVSKQFGGQEFYDLMHYTPKFNHDRHNQAFGLYQGNFNGWKIFAWDGGDWGISSQLMRFPEQEVAIIVLSNLGSGESFRKANAIANILIEEGIIN
ncbi:MAG: beta-lactamase family protein [Balneolaceae bacterium]|nr:beta-lactamase family protein [Balneolaceae bacterium]MBO6547285.1 beta-lactamase family protein [Balneolaceae bacterium]MBO6647768.1 beta-lactamase family protein [Balneolaceae bacterium]